MAAALEGAAAGSVVGAREAQGLVSTLVEGLNKNVLTFTWRRSWKDRKLILQGVQVNISTGLILGGVALALLWEAANWFAHAVGNLTPGNIAKGVEAAIPTMVDLMAWGINPIGSAIGSALVLGIPTITPDELAKATEARDVIKQWLSRKVVPANATPPPGGSVTLIPATAGQAYNAMIRDALLAGPASMAQKLRDFMAAAIAQGGAPKLSQITGQPPLGTATGGSPPTQPHGRPIFQR